MIKCGHGKPLDQECLACEKLDGIHDRLRARVAKLETALRMIQTASSDRVAHELATAALNLKP